MSALVAPGWVEVDCPLCGSRERHRRFGEGRVEVRRCRDCDLVYVSPRRTAEGLIAQVYDASYWRSEAPRRRGYADYEGDQELWRRTWRARLAVIAAHLPESGRALDVGCASGLFLEELARRGWKVEGIEPSRAMAARAAARLGAGRVRGLRLDQLELEPNAYDLICLWDVIEHLPRPVEELRRLRESLAPGGRLVLLTQDVSSLAARALGRRWHHYKHDEHLLHFSPATLQRALARAGLRSVHRTRRATGKWVRWSFVVERARRLGRPVSAFLAALPIAADRSLWINPRDEMLIVAERAGEEG